MEVPGRSALAAATLMLTGTLVAGCGLLLSFGTQGEAGDAGDAGLRLPSDGNRTDAPRDGSAADACRPDELCGGGDEDCDGQVDEGCPCGEPVAVTRTEETRSEDPSLVWTGAGFGLTWHEESLDRSRRRLYFQRLDRRGRPVGAPSLVGTESAHSELGALAWSGTELGLAWEDHRHAPGSDAGSDIYFVRLDAAGARLGPEVRVTTIDGELSTANQPVVVWAGEETGWGIAWTDDRDGRRDPYFRVVGADGRPDGSLRRVAATPHRSEQVSLAWSGGGFAAGWMDRDAGALSVWYAAIGGGDVVQIAPEPSDDPKLWWTGAEFAVVHEQQSGPASEDGDLYVSNVRDSGVSDAKPLVVTEGDTDEPAIAWSGTELGIAFEAFDPGSNDIHFARFDADGSERQALTPLLESETDNSIKPSLTWAGGRYAVAWQQRTATGPDVYDVYFAWACP